MLIKNHDSIKKVLAFLRNHPSQAFRSRELADELIGTTFYVEEKRNQLKEELTKREYQERSQNNELPERDDHLRLTNIISLRYMDFALDKLRDIGFVEVREVDAKIFDVPSNNTTLAYTYSDDISYEK